MRGCPPAEAARITRRRRRRRAPGCRRTVAAAAAASRRKHVERLSGCWTRGSTSAWTVGSMRHHLTPDDVVAGYPAEPAEQQHKHCRQHPSQRRPRRSQATHHHRRPQRWIQTAGPEQLVPSATPDRSARVANRELCSVERLQGASRAGPDRCSPSQSQAGHG